MVGRRVGFVALGVAGLVLMVTGTLGLSLGQYLSPEYQFPLMAVLFAAALAVQDSIRKADIARLSERHASIRLKEYPLFQITNVGELEARRVRISTVNHGTYPWVLEFSEVASVWSGEASPRTKIAKRQGIHCDDCTGAPHSDGELFLNMVRHDLHASEAKRATSAIDSQDTKRAVGALMGLPTELAVPFRIDYADSHERRMRVTYTLVITADVQKNQLLSLSLLLGEEGIVA